MTEKRKTNCGKEEKQTNESPSNVMNDEKSPIVNCVGCFSSFFGDSIWCDCFSNIFFRSLPLSTNSSLPEHLSLSSMIVAVSVNDESCSPECFEDKSIAIRVHFYQSANERCVRRCGNRSTNEAKNETENETKKMNDRRLSDSTNNGISFSGWHWQCLEKRKERKKLRQSIHRDNKGRCLPNAFASLSHSRIRPVCACVCACRWMWFIAFSIVQFLCRRWNAVKTHMKNSQTKENNELPKMTSTPAQKLNASLSPSSSSFVV